MIEERTPIPRLDRPLDEPLRLLATPKRVRARLEGQWIVDSHAPALLLGYQKTPLYCFPREHVRTEWFEAQDEAESDPVLGRIRVYDLTVGDNVAARAAWEVVEAVDGLPGIEQRLFVPWDAADAWFEEDEEVFVHPRDPTKRIDVLESSRHVVVEHAGELLAESTRPRLLIEPGLPVRYYVPKLDVTMDLLEPSDTVTECPYKGRATHYALASPQGTGEDVAWCYEHPNPVAVKVQGLISFYNERVEHVRVDEVARDP